MLRRLSITLILMAFAPFLAAQEPDQAIHDELRGLLTGIEEAINTQRYADLPQYFTEHARLTPITQEVLSSRADIEPYFNKWFGPGGYLKSLRMKLNADAITELYADNTVGIVRGSGDEDYVLSDTRTFPMKTRWTATVIKDTDGKWRILSLHIGTNFLDNPILSVAEASAKYMAAGGVIAGLLLGLLIGFFWKRSGKGA
jgi:ketosteroid isomerase-like protein